MDIKHDYWRIAEKIMPDGKRYIKYKCKTCGQIVSYPENKDIKKSKYSYGCLPKIEK